MIPNNTVTVITTLVTGIIALLGLVLYMVNPESALAMNPAVAWPLIAAALAIFGIGRKVERIAKAAENGKR